MFCINNALIQNCKYNYVDKTIITPDKYQSSLPDKILQQIKYDTQLKQRVIFMMNLTK